MKKSTFFLVSFLFAGFTVSAQVLDTLYNAKSQLPAAALWNELILDKTISDSAAVITQELQGGVLKLKTVNANKKDSKLGWYKTGLGLNLSTGYTIEIKAKVNNATKNGAFNLQGYDNQGKGFRFGIYKTFLANQTNPLGATTTVASALDNSTDFHTFRLAVHPTGLVTVYRDKVEIGTFPLSAFYFDNIIVNGGFEDGTDVNDGSTFPDFLSRGLLYKSTALTARRTGNYALVMNSNGKTEKTGGNYNIDTQEDARTREIAVKPNTKYDISITRRRIAIDNAWCWRDMGAFYNTQVGTEKGTDARNTNAFWGGANDDFWQIHNQTITTPADVKSIRFEFPAWGRDGNTTAINSFDDFVFREQPTLAVGVTTAPAVYTPNTLPATFTNLIQNGGFEDFTLDNAGDAYTWALSDLASGSDNNPTLPSPLWNGEVRIQRHDQSNDGLSEGYGAQKWAHSGTACLRFSTKGNKANNFDFTKQLKPDTKYRLSFWHKSPKWDDFGWLRVKLGEGDDNTAIWGQELKGRNNVWTNCDIVFTTDATNTKLHLYTNSNLHGDWWNLYLDDMVLYEVTAVTDPNLFAGKTNMIANGSFEDAALNNDGTAYNWALASTNTDVNNNYPVKMNDMWGSYVQLQDRQKNADTGIQYANSGTKSLRFSFLDDRGAAKAFEGITIDSLPSAFRLNMNFKKELEPNKTYTFVFWVKAANYGDAGRLNVSNGNIKVWSDVLNTRNINWTREVVTFSTTAANHTLNMYTEFGGWFNFYLDDLALYEESTYVPYEANGESYLFFGKSQGTEDTDVEIQYVAVNNTGAFAPNIATGISVAPAAKMKVTSNAGILTINTMTPTLVKVYDIAGAFVAEFNVQSTKDLTLPQGVYIVKSATEVVKVVNK